MPSPYKRPHPTQVLFRIRHNISFTPCTENREITCMSWSKDQDRSAKAINRTADMNVQEKSDCAVVPVNQPNNEGLLSAEVGEGRAQTKENIDQSHMSPTQSGERVSQGLRGVRQAARE